MIFMGWKEKEYKKTQKALEKDSEEHPYDAEMLRIQGLIRCKGCESPYPFMHRNCPSCGEANHEKYPLKD